MKQNPFRKWLLAGVLVAAQAFLAAAQTEPAATPSGPSAPAPKPANNASVKPAGNASQNQASEPGATSHTPYSASMEEILRMVQAGVSKDVMKAYIDAAQVPAPLTAADLVALKERGVPDEITVALVKRDAELMAQSNAPAGGNAAQPPMSGRVSLDALVAALRGGQSGAGSLDPEGYDYFRYYYLYPRSLASANQRLWSSCPPFACPGYPFGYWSPGLYRPRPLYR
jgi:hypothetical protein